MATKEPVQKPKEGTEALNERSLHRVGSRQREGIKMMEPRGLRSHSGRAIDRMDGY